MKSRKLYTGCFDAVLCLSTITICTSHDIKEISKNYPRQFYISCLERVHCVSGVSLCTTHNCSVGLPLTSLISQSTVCTTTNITYLSNQNSTAVPAAPQTYTCVCDCSEGLKRIAQDFLCLRPISRFMTE